MLQVCPDCRSAYHWEFPRFGCACGRFDPSLAPLAAALGREREVVGAPDRAGQSGVWDSALRRDVRELRDGWLSHPRLARAEPKPRAARPQERLDLDDDDLEHLPWQHRSRDFRGNLRRRPD